MSENVEELREKMVDVRPFKRDFVKPDEASIAAIRFGFRYGAWDRERIPAEVMDDLRRAYPRPPRHSKKILAKLFEGHMLARLERYGDAIKCYDDAIKTEPGDTAALYGKGDALFASGNRDGAIECYNKAVDADPDHPEKFYDRCEKLLDEGMVDEALEGYDRAIDIDPTSADALCGKGDALARKRMYDDAIKWYDEALGFDPNHPAALNGKGKALAKLRKDDDAMRLFDKVGKLVLFVDMKYGGDHIVTESLFNRHAKDAGHADEVTKALCNKAVLLCKQNRTDELAETYGRVIDLKGYDYMPDRKMMLAAQ